VFSLQHYVIKLVSDFLEVGGFLRVLREPSRIKLTATIYVESSVKHHNPEEKWESMDRVRIFFLAMGHHRPLQIKCSSLWIAESCLVRRTSVILRTLSTDILPFLKTELHIWIIRTTSGYLFRRGWTDITCTDWFELKANYRSSNNIIYSKIVYK